MPTILHLTDIHFGWEGNDPSGLADRKVCLDGLLNQLRTIEPEWKPTIICLTGDIGWRGISSDYAEAKKWLDELLAISGLTYNDLVVCAGNHDVFRPKAKKLPRPESTKDADEVLSPPIAQHFEGPFSDFMAFCKLANIPELTFGNGRSQLVGERQVNGFRFVIFNSAWFSKDDDDKGKLWLGQGISAANKPAKPYSAPNLPSSFSWSNWTGRSLNQHNAQLNAFSNFTGRG
jgi:calcineurin-like phosphoesterase family protein